MKTAKTHLLKALYLADKLIFFKLCVPGPEWRRAVFCSWIFKKLL
jgi:hypothetical protein